MIKLFITFAVLSMIVLLINFSWIIRERIIWNKKRKAEKENAKGKSKETINSKTVRASFWITITNKKFFKLAVIIDVFFITLIILGFIITNWLY